MGKMERRNGFYSGMSCQEDLKSGLPLRWENLMEGICPSCQLFIFSVSKKDDQGRNDRSGIYHDPYQFSLPTGSIRP